MLAHATNGQGRPAGPAKLTLIEAMDVCPACGGTLTRFGEAPFKVRGRTIPTRIDYCRRCDVFCRAVAADRLVAHFDDAGYTRDRNRQVQWDRRKGFFHHLIDLAEDHCDVRPIRFLDVGAAYGHLIRVGEERGHIGAGTEIVDRLRQAIKASGAECWASLADASGRFDAVFFIDSFYYFDDPRAELVRTAALLAPRGIIVIRVSNRNLLIRALSKLGSERRFEPLHDMIVGWSLKGLARLLEDLGFSIERVMFSERGWQRPRVARVLYPIAASVSRVTARWSFAVSPGLMILARRVDVLPGDAH
jgi:SAM-dependent methyltransferase